VAIRVILPKLGLTMQEGVIEEWVVAPGTQVSPGDILIRIGTDKVDADVEAEDSGRFHPAVQAGVTLPPGALVGWLLAEGEEPPSVGTPQAAVLGDVDRGVSRQRGGGRGIGPARRPGQREPGAAERRPAQGVAECQAGGPRQ